MDRGAGAIALAIKLDLIAFLWAIRRDLVLVETLGCPTARDLVCIEADHLFVRILAWQWFDGATRSFLEGFDLLFTETRLV